MFYEFTVMNSKFIPGMNSKFIPGRVARQRRLIKAFCGAASFYFRIFTREAKAFF